MTKQYFNDNVVWAVEVDYGRRYWETVKGEKELNEYCERHEDDLSDVDFAIKQEDEWVRDVLNTAEYNFRNNLNWCKKQGLTSFQDVIDFIIDNGLVKSKADMWREANELKGCPYNRSELTEIDFRYGEYTDETLYKDPKGNFWYSVYYIGD